MYRPMQFEARVHELQYIFSQNCAFVLLSRSTSCSVIVQKKLGCGPRLHLITWCEANHGFY